MICLDEKYKPEERYKAVVDHGKGLLVVSAGPGTGKTFSLLRKIESLLKLDVDPKKIYYLTFVNSIVDAFEKDIEKKPEEGGLGTSADELGINISTLHSIAFKIVKTYSSELELAEHLELIDLSPRPVDLVSQLFVKDLYTEAHRTFKCSREDFDNKLEIFQKNWRNNSKIDPSLKELHRIVDVLCLRYVVLPWDLLVPLANSAIEQYGLPIWLSGAQHFLIDEFQDFNPAEQQLITRITEPSDSVVIVGDADQSIYGGRSASPEGLGRLLEKEDVTTVNFVYCRRCPQTVIEAANDILGYIDPVGFKTKKLVPYKTSKGKMTLKITKSCKAEIDFLAERIRRWQEEDLSRIIMLFPMRRGIRYYQERLEDRGIRCEIAKINVEEEMLSIYLRLAIYSSHPMLERAFLNKFENLDRRYSLDVLPLFISEFLTLGDALKKISENNCWRKVVQSEYEKYKLELSSLMSGDSQKIVSFLKEKGFDIDVNNIEKLLDDSSNKTVLERINSIIEKILKQTKKGESDTKSDVKLLTMHSSKGLSEEVVIMPAFEDKWLPGNSKGNELEEKNRLFFVALTRSETEVMITYPKTRARKDPLCFCPYNTKEGISRYAKVIKKSCTIL